MSDTLKLLLSLTISGSLLTLLIAFISNFWGNKLKKSWQYYIWLIVALRLLIPFGFGESVVGRLLPELPTEVYSYNYVDEQVNDINKSLPFYEQSSSQANSFNPLNANNIYSILFVIWIVVAIVLLVRKFTLYQSFLKYISAGKSKPSDIEELEVFSELCEKMNIKRAVDLTTNELISSPLLIGYLKPKVVLPSFDFTREEQKYIYTHELTHLKRNDIIYKWLLQLAQCIYWFNPLVYYMVRKVNELCELSCDESIIKELSKEETQHYGETLLNTLKTRDSYNEPIATLALSENATLLSNRLTSIKLFTTPKMTVKFIFYLIVTMLCIVALFTVGSANSVSLLPTSIVNENEANPNQYQSFVMDDTVLMLIENGGANDGIWYITEYLIPYMTNDGIDNAVNFFNTKHSGKPKVASEYKGYPIPSRSETLYRATEIINRTNNWRLVEPLIPYLSEEGLYQIVELYNSKNEHKLNPTDYTRSLFMKE